MQALIDNGTVARTVHRHEVDPAADPRRRRYAINPGALSLDVHPTLSGRQLGRIPFGVMVRFDTFEGMRSPNWSVDPEDHSSLDTTRDLTALEAVENVTREALANGTYDMGFRELSSLTTLTDAEAERLFAIVHPTFTDPCPFDSARPVELRGRCVACRLAWLESDDCAEMAEQFNAVRLRAELLSAYRACESYFREQWAEWKAELAARKAGEKKGLTVLKEGHLHVMRQLHELHPDQEQAAAIRDNQQAQADSFKEGIRELVGEMRNNQPQQPAQPVMDMSALREELKAEMKAELLAELRADKKAK